MAKKHPSVRKKIAQYLPLLIAVALTLALIAVVVLTVTGGGPVDRLLRAGKSTVFADSFTTVFTLSVNEESYEGNLNVAIDTDDRELTFYLQLATNTSDYICGIYQNDFALCDASTNELEITDVEDRLTAFFDALEEDGEPDWALLLDFSETDLYGKISGDFDVTTLMACIGEFLNTLNDETWAETYAGYATDRESGVTLHRFSPSPELLAEQIIPIFRPAFLDSARYDALTQYVEEAHYLLAAGTADVTFGVKGSKLVSAELDIRYHNFSLQGSFEFIGINSTVVDYDTIAYFIDQADKSAEERFEDHIFQ